MLLGIRSGDELVRLYAWTVVVLITMGLVSELWLILLKLMTMLQLEVVTVCLTLSAGITEMDTSW